MIKAGGEYAKKAVVLKQKKAGPWHGSGLIEAVTNLRLLSLFLFEGEEAD